MVKKYEDVLFKLKSSGFRVTPVRRKILEILINSKAPISATDLIEEFRNLKFKVNKTTIYRELDFLWEKQILSELEFGEGKKRYEINTGHHHHIICLNCKKIEDVKLQTDLSEEERRIEINKGFKVQNHSLEFFGYCKNCQ